MTRYLRLFALQFRISAASAMAYRANFLVEGLMSAMWMTLTLVPLFVVFGHGGGRDLAGWYRASALIVMAYFVGVHAVLEGMITPSLIALSRRSGPAPSTTSSSSPPMPRPWSRRRATSRLSGAGLDHRRLQPHQPRSDSRETGPQLPSRRWPACDPRTASPEPFR